MTHGLNNHPLTPEQRAWRNKALCLIWITAICLAIALGIYGGLHG